MRPVRWLGALCVAVALVGYARLLPQPLFDAPYATVLEAADGQLLSARIAADGQWRLPPGDTLDERYAVAVQLYEDEHFRRHLGLDAVAIVAAMRQNWRAGRTVRGGSTITQQTVRLARGSPARTLGEKLVEAVWATRLELGYSKDEILGLYAAHAPFGGNVVGVEAAGWRYFGRAPQHLSWAEAAALAVLPNAPGVIYPGRADAAFRRKRDGLLDKLHARGHLDTAALVLAKAEPLPGAPYPLPDLTPHALLSHAAPGRRSRSTLDAELQARLTALVARQHRRTRGNGVHNAAALIAEVGTGRVLAYVGNTACDERVGAGRAVDVAQAPRSSGSTLKPFLYAALLDEGRVAPGTLLPDIPTLIAGYAPQNFDLGFDGAVPAAEALTRSLNVPHVRLLREYGVAAFQRKLGALGLTTLTRPPGDYGLSLVLGGGEVTLWELAGAYRGLAHTVGYYTAGDRGYTSASWGGVIFNAKGAEDTRRAEDAKGAGWGGDASAPPLGAGAAYLTLEALTGLTRPSDFAGHRAFRGARRVAWKTGSSQGLRDAWAVGVTPDYVVAVWTGNADGEGRPGLTGAAVAAPLLFEAFDLLPATGWFRMPVEDLATLRLCAASGLRAGRDCPTPVPTLLPPAAATHLGLCPYHARVYVDAAGRRVDASCYPLAAARADTVFALPPAWGQFYGSGHPGYRTAPPWAPGCRPARDAAAMAWVYPRGGRELHLPRDLAGRRQAVAFEVAHAEGGQALRWFLDDVPVGVTRGPHQQPLAPAAGAHRVTVVDAAGRSLDYAFAVVD